MSSREEIYQKIVSILTEMFEIDAAIITPEANLYSDLDIDSIDAVDLVVELKKMTGKKIQAEDFKSVRTIDDVVTEVQKLLSSGE